LFEFLLEREPDTTSIRREFSPDVISQPCPVRARSSGDQR
jgi:hypothetical protein